jgi:hypothetical protein
VTLAWASVLSLERSLVVEGNRNSVVGRRIPAWGQRWGMHQKRLAASWTGGQTFVLSLSKVEPALLAKSLLEPRVVAYGGKVVVSARVFPEPR